MDLLRQRTTLCWDMLTCNRWLIYCDTRWQEIFLGRLATELGCLLELWQFVAIGWLWCIWLRFLHHYSKLPIVVLTFEDPRRDLSYSSCLSRRGWSTSLSLNVIYRIWNELIAGNYRRSVAASHVCTLRCSSRFFNNYSIRGLTFGLIIILLCFLFLICQRYQFFIGIT